MRDGTSELMADLAMNCMQLVCILLYCKVPPVEVFEAVQKDSLLVPVKEVIVRTGPYQPLNYFEETVKEIKELSDIVLLYKGVEKIFENSLGHLYSQNLFRETMTLLLKVVKVNPNIVSELYLYGYDFNFLLTITCHHMLRYSAKDGTEFFVNLNLSLLQQFCLFRDFAVGLNNACTAISGAHLAYTEAAFIDCFIVFVRDIVLTPYTNLEELVSTLLGILANMYFDVLFIVRPMPKLFPCTLQLACWKYSSTLWLMLRVGRRMRQFTSRLLFSPSNALSTSTYT